MSNRNDPVVAFQHTDAAAQWALSEDRVPVFTVSKPYVHTGDEPEGFVTPEPEIVTYTMPAKPNPGLALRYLKMAREQGDVANGWIIETAIGEEGYFALADELAAPEIDDPMKILRDIVAKIQRIAMGGLEAPKA